MSIKIDFVNNEPIMPTLVLAERNGHKIGVIYDTTGFEFEDNLNAATEFNFSINKYQNGTLNQFWDLIDNFKLIWIKEYDIWFEITVKISETNNLIKIVEAVSLCEAELSQILLFNIEINTQTDIAREDYIEPTVFYNPEQPEASLIHRLMDKIPHYSIGHIDESLKNIQRIFSFDNISIYDALEEVSKELQCLFIFDSGTDENDKIARSISAYDLCDICLDCGYRGVITDVCPECSGTNLTMGYGLNSMVYVDNDCLSEEIELSVDTNSYKNCFKLEAGDDLMTATIINCNPNGSGYLWRLDENIRNGMTDELKDKLIEYDIAYSSFDEYSVISYDIYNDVVDKYKAMYDDLDIPYMPETITTFADLMKNYYYTIDFEHYLKSECMPVADINNHIDLNEQIDIINALHLNNVGTVIKLDNVSQTTATSYTLAMVKTYVNEAYYKVSISGVPSYNNVTHQWIGQFRVESLADETIVGNTNFITLILTNDYQTYMEQRIRALLRDENEVEGDYLIDLFSSTLYTFTQKIKLHCLDNLNSYLQICQSVLDILMTFGAADSDKEMYSIYDNTSDGYEIYEEYLSKMEALNNEINVRENSDLFVVRKIQNDLLEQKINHQQALDIQNFIGTDLWNELCAYRREDVYNNSNFISDGLSNDELFARALEFISLAKDELYRVSTYQYSISTTLKNLLITERFKNITDTFSVGNWIHLRVNNELYKLRLIHYQINYDDLTNIDVEFSDMLKVKNGLSDVSDVLDQMSSFSSSYNAVLYQAQKTKTNTQFISDWVNKGLDATNVMIANNMDNQEIIFDKHGILCRQYDDIIDDYSSEQVKIIHKGLFFTNDNWQHVKTGIGNFIYYDPLDGEFKNGYGVIADTIVANIVLSSKVGIYNQNNSITLDENGLTINANGTNGINKDFLTIQSTDGQGNVKKMLYMNSAGKLVIEGSDVSIKASAMSEVISGIEAEITASTEGITQRVSTAETNISSLTGRVTTVETNESSLAIQANNITARVSQVITGLVDAQGHVIPASDTSTTVSLDSQKLQIAWSGISDYVSIENGGLYIKTNSTVSAVNLAVLNGTGLTIYNGAITVKDDNNNNVFYTDATSHKTIFSGDLFIRLLREGQSSTSTLIDGDGSIQCNNQGWSYNEYYGGIWYETIKLGITSEGGVIEFYSFANNEYNQVGRINSVFFSSADSMGWGYDLVFLAETNGDSNQGAVRIIGSGAAALRIGYGDLLYSGNLVSISDKRVKKNIMQLKDEEVISIVNELNPVSFNFINDDENIQHYGLVAQELIEILHTHNIDINKSALISNKNSNYYSVGYIELIPLLIKTVQYQQKQIKELQKEGYKYE